MLILSITVTHSYIYCFCCETVSSACDEVRLALNVVPVCLVIAVVGVAWPHCAHDCNAVVSVCATAVTLRSQL